MVMLFFAYGMNAQNLASTSIADYNKTVSNDKHVEFAQKGVVFASTVDNVVKNTTPKGTVYSSGVVNIATVDNSVVTSTINISDNEIVGDVNVSFTITHTWSADLDVYLTSPSGTTVEITTDNGGSADDTYTGTVFDDEATESITVAIVPYTGSYIPEGALSDFDGELLAGDWTLSVADDAGGDGGALVEWSLDIEFYVPLSYDASIVDIPSLSGNVFPGSNDVVVTLSNLGVYTMTACDVYYDIVNASTGVSVASDVYSWSGSLDLGFSEDVTIGSFVAIAGETYTITAFSDLVSDEDISNNIYISTFTTYTATAIPYSQDFDTPYGWENIIGDNGDWYIVTSMGHGAYQDHTTGTGYFAGLDDSSPMESGYFANFLTPVFDLSGLTAPGLYFYYQNVDDGAVGVGNISELHVDVTTDGINWTNDILVITEEVNQWTEFSINITPLLGSFAQFRFRGVTTNNYLSDPSVDDFEIKQLPDNDLIATSVSPNGFLYNGTYTGVYPEVSIYNAGGMDQSTYSVNVTVTDPSTGVEVYNETVVDPATILAGGTYTCTMTTLLDVDYGTYSITAFVDLTGDENPDDNLLEGEFSVTRWYHGDNGMPMNSYMMSSAAYSGALGNLLFSIGGNTITFNNNEVFVYDVDSQTWTQTTSLPVSSVVGAATAYDDNIFVHVGASGSYTNTCLSYDIASEVWSPIADLPIEIGWTSATTNNGSIYVAGGYDGVNYFSSVYRYDPVGDAWTTAADLPMAAMGGSLITVDNKLVYVWGAQGAGTLDGYAMIGEIDPMDADVITWTTTAVPAELGTYKMTAAPISDNAFIVTSGDYAGWVARPNTYIYYIATDEWVRIDDKPLFNLGYAAGSFYDGATSTYVTASGYNGSFITDVEYFMIDVNVPEAATYMPAMNETEVALDATVSVEFNVGVNQLYTPTVSIFDGTNFVNVTGLTFNDATNTLEISHDMFDYGTTYSVTIDAGAFMSEDLDGSLNDVISWNFTTLETYSVTFNVDMTAPIALEYFIVGTDVVYLTGSMVDWAEPGTDPTMEMTDADGDYIYSITLDVTNGDAEYKYFQNAGWAGGEWDGGDNRMFTVAGSNLTLDDVWAMEYLIIFSVTDGTNALEGASVTIGGVEDFTDVDGLVPFAGIDGTYSYTVSLDGYEVVSDFAIVAGDHQVIDVVLDPLSLNNIFANVSITPNPTSGLVTIYANDMYNVQIIDVNGKLLSSVNMTSNNTTIDITSYEAGLYIVKLSKDGASASYKVIKK